MTHSGPDFYQSLRHRIRTWAATDDGEQHKWTEYLLAAPDLFHLLCKLAIDDRVAIADKAKLAGAIAYFVSPVDLIPEGVVGPVGYLDDIALAAYVLNGIVNNANPEIVQDHWAGDGDVLDIIESILEAADDMVGGGLWERLKGLASSDNDNDKS